MIIIITVQRLNSNMGVVDTSDKRRKASLQKEIVFYSVKFVVRWPFYKLMLPLVECYRCVSNGSRYCWLVYPEKPQRNEDLLLWLSVQGLATYHELNLRNEGLWYNLNFYQTCILPFTHCHKDHQYLNPVRSIFVHREDELREINLQQNCPPLYSFCICKLVY